MSSDNHFAASDDELTDLENRFGALLDNEELLQATRSYSKGSCSCDHGKATEEEK